MDFSYLILLSMNDLQQGKVIGVDSHPEFFPNLSAQRFIWCFVPLHMAAWESIAASLAFGPV